MNFSELPTQTKKELHTMISEYATGLGGVNFFLQMIEDVKKEKPNPLLNQSAACHYSRGVIRWEKSIYKDTMMALYAAMRKEDKDGDMLEGLAPKEYKKTMNMMRTLKPITLTVMPKKEENAQSFSFPILNATTDKKTEVSWMFKVIFFYNVDFAKKALNYEIK